MNARERRVLNRIAERKAATVETEQSVRPKDQKGLQANKANMIDTSREPRLPETGMGRALRIGKRTAQMIGAMIGFSAAILGLVTGYVALLPRISVSQNEPRDLSDPFSSPFIVSNDGPLPIENVRFRCGIGQALYKNGPQVKGGSNFGSSFIFAPDANGHLPEQNFGTAEMNPGERSTIPSCNYPFPKSIEGADIGIVVTFRIGYTPVTTQRIFRFSTLADANKQLHWFPYPLK
jgi:hypothetical protein